MPDVRLGDLEEHLLDGVLQVVEALVGIAGWDVQDTLDTLPVPLLEPWVRQGLDEGELLV